MDKIKILLFIDWFLPGTKSGGPVRSYANLISHFKDDYDFYVITRNVSRVKVRPVSSGGALLESIAGLQNFQGAGRIPSSRIRYWAIYGIAIFSVPNYR